MKILRATSKGELDKMYDEKALRRLDEEQNRRRLNGAEVEALIGMATASNLLSRTAPVLKSLAIDTEQQRRIRLAETMLGNAVKRVVRKVNASQLITIANNINDVTITLSATPVDGWCNINWKDMMVIVDQALATCQMGCDKSRDESKRCPIRKALENVPGIRDTTKSRGNTMDCPFAGMGLEWEEEA